MSTLELAADLLARDLDMLKMTLSDLSDADMLVRPAAGANHAAWQLGHLASAESWMVNAVAPGAGGELPAGFADRFSKEAAKTDDPAAFPKKAELIDAFEKVRSATIRWVKGLTDADLARPGPEKMRNFAPTVGHLILMTPVHTTMHTGQFQVIRRKLGKPVLF
jgi:uncharacterized damage-inducible protein DinB